MSRSSSIRKATSITARVWFAAWLFAFAASMTGCSGERRPTNVLLIVVDTLRADGLGVYGNPHAVSPAIDAFAADAIVFENAYAPAPNTVPSHASLFTSTYPATHQVWNQIRVEGYPNIHPRLSPRHRTLAETLKDAGYVTAAIAGGGFVRPVRGLGQGFDQFETNTLGVKNRYRTAIQWLRGRKRERPFFLFLHTYEAHSPYLPPVGSEDRFTEKYSGPLRQALTNARAFEASGREKDKFFDVQMKFFFGVMQQKRRDDIAFLRGLYDAEVNNVDRYFGHLLAVLTNRGYLDDTLIVLTADHGEQFMEHGEFYHYHVYEEGLRIPLIVRDPAGPFGVRRSELVDLVDVMPTVLERLGIAIPPAAVGRPIDLGAAETSPEPRFLVGEVARARFERQLSVRNGEWSVVFHGDELERAEVFDLRSDPAEGEDLAGSDESSAIVARAREVAAEHAAAAGHKREKFGLDPILPEQQQLGEAERDQLRALGYLDE